MESGASTSARSSWGVMTRQPSGFTSNLSEGCTPSSILPSLGEDASTRAFNPDQMCKGGSRFTVKKAPGCADLARYSRNYPSPRAPLPASRGEGTEYDFFTRSEPALRRFAPQGRLARRRNLFALGGGGFAALTKCKIQN